MRTLQSELDRIGGNIMAYYADKQREIDHRVEVLSMTNDTHCKNCGARECQKYDEYQKEWVVVKLNNNGLCGKCCEELFIEDENANT